MNLKDIVKEIEKIGNLYRNSEDSETKKTYNQYITLIILNEAEKSEQYNLGYYWEKLIR